MKYVAGVGVAPTLHGKRRCATLLRSFAATIEPHLGLTLPYWCLSRLIHYFSFSPRDLYKGQAHILRSYQNGKGWSATPT